jgi:hypothetical protein
VDELGAFRLQPIPPGSFRMHCRTDDDDVATTPWISL